MNARYDVVILGCGEAGIFAAYELAHLHPELKVLALDQGADIYHRSCPIVAGKVKECIHCPVCHTMCGFGGAGAFSDGKFNFTTQFGGWLTDFMDPRHVMDLIDYVDCINVRHGATTQVFSTESDAAKQLARRALAYDLHLLQARLCLLLGCYEGEATRKVLDWLKDRIPEELLEKLSGLAPIVIDIDELGGTLEKQIAPYQDVLTQAGFSVHIDFEDIYCAGAYFLSVGMG